MADLEEHDGQRDAREHVGVVALARHERVASVAHRREGAAAGEHAPALKFLICLYEKRGNTPCETRQIFKKLSIKYLIKRQECFQTPFTCRKKI